MLPRHKQKKLRKPRRQPDTSTWPKRKHLKPEDLEGLQEKIQQAFGWSELPRTHQAGAIEAQLFGNSVLVHAGTGSGKTAIAAGPHVHEKSKGKVTLMVSPLIALQEEQVQTFEEEYKLKAVAVNSAHGGCKPELMTKICSGEYQIVVISPEMLLSKRFIKNVLKNTEFGSRILSVVIDEAHVVSHWGSGFRKQYGRLGILRMLLPKGTPVVTMSATLPPRVQKDVLNKLRLGQDYIKINLGNDRPNVSIVVRAIHNTMNTYSDLDFLIPNNVTEASQIPKAFVYADNISTGPDIEQRLYERLPEHLRELGLIRPYSAAYTKEYRAELMRLFKLGVVRILICTDAAGMGCNIPDIDIVVQWKLPTNVSSFVQRAGRAARAAGRVGLAVLLVEKSAYEADLSRLETNLQKEAGKGKRKRKKAAGVRQSEGYTKASKEYAVLHGVNRGGHGGQDDNKELATDDVIINFDAADEGLHSLVQTVRCRRRVLTKIFGNDEPNPTVPCCDLCHPALLDRTRPSEAAPVERAVKVKRGEPNDMVKSALHTWRTSVKAQDFSESLIGASGILKDETIELLSSVGPIPSKEHLERILGGRWLWFATYGESLWNHLQGLVIPPLQPKPKATSSKKHAPTELNEVQGGSQTVPADGRKRQRKEAPSRASSTQRPRSNQVTPRALHASTSRPTSIPNTMTPTTPHNYHHYAYPGNPYIQPPYYPPSVPQAFHYSTPPIPLPSPAQAQATPTPTPRSQNPYINYYLSTPCPSRPPDPPPG
ncbi:putative atp-dependent dna helicase [Lyophyllum shimeji]|uniref:DNA 3'-5' helicase n=1 Tax=Lyophyllum shimeji TaxID=47721 RepID=A0A9P3UQS0_LYOSH|nr:putative atp-dependent dna helicase [Lyophyllum shimeji]